MCSQSRRVQNAGILKVLEFRICVLFWHGLLEGLLEDLVCGRWMWSFSRVKICVRWKEQSSNLLSAALPFFLLLFSSTFYLLPHCVLPSCIFFYSLGRSLHACMIVLELANSAYVIMQRSSPANGCWPWHSHKEGPGECDFTWLNLSTLMSHSQTIKQYITELLPKHIWTGKTQSYKMTPNMTRTSLNSQFSSLA